MSLVVAFNLDDYAILATDKRGVLCYGDGEESIFIRKDDYYQKLRQIPFGFFAAAGDYVITECFYEECVTKLPKNRNLEQILEATYYRYCNLKDIYHFSEKTTILLVAKGFNQDGDLNEDVLLEINIEFESIKIQEVNSMHLVALMANMNSDQSFWDKTGHLLRSSNDFVHFEDFFSYHVYLMKYIWQEQLKFDDLISHHIDFYFHNKRTSQGILLSAEEFNIPLLELSHLLHNFKNI